MTEKLTLEEQATNYETMKHIHQVGKNIHILVSKLLKRADNHDASKLESPEVEFFTQKTHLLSGLTYGSEEYNQCLKELAPALEHHYANNRHHAAHYDNGINDMNIVDFIEMFCDWAASCKRHNDGNLNKSIEINAKRFDMPEMMVNVLKNSVEMFE